MSYFFFGLKLRYFFPDQDPDDNSAVLIRTSHKNILEISDFFQTLFEGNFRQFSDRTMNIFRL